jgi:hypothetical protein
VKLWAMITLTLALALVGCSRDSAPRPKNSLTSLSGRTGELVIRTGEHEVKVAVDANHDGKLDLVKTYRDGRLVRIEQDRNADGRVDFVQEYRDDELSREVRDDNFDGKPETVSTYRHGKLAIVEHDPDGSGWAQRTDYYDDSGKLIRSERPTSASAPR